jgi:hypothetical protein
LLSSMSNDATCTGDWRCCCLRLLSDFVIFKGD